MYTESEKNGWNLPRSFLLLPQTHLTDTPRTRWGLFPPPCFTSCPALCGVCHHGWPALCAGGAAAPYSLAPDVMGLGESVLLFARVVADVRMDCRDRLEGGPLSECGEEFRGGICGFLSKVACPGHVAKSCHYSHYVNIPSTCWRFFYVFLRA